MSNRLSRNTSARLGGALLLGSGLVLTKISVLDVLAKARAGAAVTTSIKAVVVAPMLLTLGLLLLVIGAPGEPKPGSLVLYFVTGHGPTSRLKPLGYALVFVLLALGFGLHVWLEGELRSLGYS